MPDVLSLPGARRIAGTAFAVVLAATLLGSLSAVVIGLQQTAAAIIGEEQRPELTVVAGPWSSTAPLTPGRTTAQHLRVSLSESGVYQMQAAVTGATELADDLMTTIRSSASGEVLYRGPMSSAAFEQRTLLAGATDELVIEVQLAPTADSEGAAAALEATWSFSAAPLLDR